MHHVLVQDGVVSHIWTGGKPPGIPTQSVAPGSAHVGDRWVNGQAVSSTPEVSAEEINAECERRILALFPIAHQLNVIDEGTAAQQQDLKDRRNGMRACARALCSMPQIPANYRDDRFWTGAPFESAYRQYQSQPPPMQQLPYGQIGYGQQLPPQFGNGGGYGGGYGGGNSGTNQPIIMMQAAAPAAPIIINGAQPGTTVIQGPAQVQPQMIAPPVQVIQSVPQQPAMPAPHPRQAGLPSPSSQASSPTASQPLSNLVPGGLTEAEMEQVFETAGRALSGNDWAIQKMQPIADLHGMSLNAYCQQLLKQRHANFETALDKMAHHG